MKSATRLALASLAALTLLLAGCSGDGSAGDPSGSLATTVAPGGTSVPNAAAPSTTTSSSTLAPSRSIGCDGPVTVGVVTDVSGALAVYGAHMVRGVPIGFAYATDGEAQTGAEQSYFLDDCELRVLVRDDQSNPDIGEAAALDLIETDGASIVIGSVTSGVTAKLQQVARDHNVILIAGPDSSTDLSGGRFDPNTFRISRSAYQDHMAICDLLVNDLGRKTFVQLAADYPVGHSGAQAYTDACSFYGGEFLAEPVFLPADTQDFSEYLIPLAEADADAFLLTWAGGSFPALLQSAFAEGALDDDTVLGVPFVDNLVVTSFFSSAVGTTSVIPYHYTSPSNPINDYLVDQAAVVFSALPDLYDADGMNAAIMIVEALKATDGASDADSLKAALEGLTFDGPKGRVEIRAADHVAVQDLYVVKLANLDDPELRFYENVATARPEPPCLLEGEYETRCSSLPAGSLGG